MHLSEDSMWRILCKFFWKLNMTSSWHLNPLVLHCSSSDSGMPGPDKPQPRWERMEHCYRTIYCTRMAESDETTKWKHLGPWMLIGKFRWLVTMFVTNVCFEGIIVQSLSREWKETPQNELSTTLTQIVKVKDLSRLKCHKEMKDTWFSIGFIVFSSWPHY